MRDSLTRPLTPVDEVRGRRVLNTPGGPVCSPAILRLVPAAVNSQRLVPGRHGAPLGVRQRGELLSEVRSLLVDALFLKRGGRVDRRVLLGPACPSDLSVARALPRARSCDYLIRNRRFARRHRLEQ